MILLQWNEKWHDCNECLRDGCKGKQLWPSGNCLTLQMIEERHEGDCFSETELDTLELWSSTMKNSRLWQLQVFLIKAGGIIIVISWCHYPNLNDLQHKRSWQLTAFMTRKRMNSDKDLFYSVHKAPFVLITHCLYKNYMK